MWRKMGKFVVVLFHEVFVSTSQGFEEVTQYIFKDDKPQASVRGLILGNGLFLFQTLKILEKAKSWKKNQGS